DDKHTLKTIFVNTLLCYNPRVFYHQPMIVLSRNL
ncbi:MAG: hypothetical protein ACI8WB_006141, partial [Phenylobacterium sp.]